MKLTKSQENFVVLVESKFGRGHTLSRSDLDKVAKENQVGFPYWLTKTPYKLGRGLFKLPEVDTEPHPIVPPIPPVTPAPAMAVVMMKQPKLVDDSDVSIPEKYPDYVPFGFFKNLKNIIQSKEYYPVFVTGLSGNGKTLMIEQVCAELKRECIRVNISIETDESDLLGGPTLINGNVVNRDGPVIIAMKRGAVLLIDEVDRGSNKLMCLQGILEGKPYFNKKSGEVVHPAPGFNVVATANTKGRGSDEGKYLSQILDDAFLERFPITVEQEFPSVTVEKKILTPLIDDEAFLDNLIKWADVIRKTFDEGGVDELISTRRLVHIAKAYKIFGDKLQAIELCVNRFDEDTKLSFIDLYTKIDAGEEAVKAEEPVPTEEVPF